MKRKLQLAANFMQLVVPTLALLLLGVVGADLQAQIQISFSTVEPACHGLPNGSITALPTDGTPPYSYLWSNGAQTQTISGVTAGSYTVTVTDVTLQSANESVILTEPPLLDATLVVDQTCSEPFDITANPFGGEPPYRYNWTTGAMTQSIIDVPSGYYCVTITDDGLCGVVECITVTANGPSVSVVATNVTCPGGNDGTVTATPNGGVPPYTYAWSNGASGQTIVGLTAGTYTVTLTDVNGCSDTATGIVSQPPPINIGITTNRPTCPDDTNGSITTIVSGGTGPYTYRWSNGATTSGIFNLSPGTYTLTVTDANNCPAVRQINLMPVSSLNVGGVGTPETCPGANDGFATASPNGGVMPYTYLWNNGVTEQVVQNAAPGTYTVTVTDAAGCMDIHSIFVAPAPDFSAAALGSNPSTCGVNNGSVTVSVITGVGPYTYLWNTGATTPTVFNLGAGTYTVTVTNPNGCQTTASTTLVAPPDVFVNATATPILCPGDNSGTATATVTGGTAPFTFAWNTGANTATITGLTAGSYFVTVTDANGCTASDAVVIAQAPAVNVNLSGTTIVCGTGNTGSATATPTSGTAPFTFSWNTGATTATITGLIEGTYTVTVTDANGCTAVRSIFIDVVDDLTVTVARTNPLCAGENTGVATAFPVGGSGPYTYAWNNGSHSQSISGLAPGTYIVVVTDANGCTATSSTTITAPPALVLNLSSNNPPNCFGAATGSLTASASGGTPAYTYAWSNGANTATINNLMAGTYTVTVTDDNGCMITRSATISQTPSLNVNVTGDPVVCGPNNSGSATAGVSGGTTPYTYQWSNGATTSSINGLASGTYTVTVTDANNCTGTGSITINVVSDLNVNLFPRPVLCFGGNTGSVLAQVTGGSGPYTYQWSNGVTGTPEIINLTAGTYSVTVTEADGCTTTASVVVTQPNRLVAATNGTNPNCPGEATGTASASATGGTPPYTYAWNNGSTSQNLTGLQAGTYLVTVTDANLCTGTASITLVDPPALNVNVTTPTIQCGGTDTGSAAAIVTGGTGPYTYNWSNGQTTSTAVNLMAGSYSLTVTDANGCNQVVSTIVINELPAIEIDFDITNIECTDANVGAVTATVSNGTPPYTFAWSNGQFGPTITNLTAGTYTVTVTDANGCRAVRGATVGQTAGFTAGAPGTMISCFGANDGTATATPTGGQAPFAYNWSNGAGTAIITNLGPGTYSVTITDANECFATASVVITEPAQLVATLGGTQILCGGADTGSALSTVTGGTPPYSYAWNTGATTANLTNLGPGTYVLTVTDANNCTTTATRTLVAPPTLTVDITQNSGTCNNVNEGILVANTTGGTAPLTYSWSNGANTATASNLAPGTYTVTVTDANGCMVTSTAGLTTFPAPSCSINVDQVADRGNNGQLTAMVTSGTPPFTYNWSNGGTTATINGLTAGTYTLTVTDANGCRTECSATLDLLAGIGNYVWEDIDHDGQQDDNEPPIPNVTVNLKDADGNIIATTTTDANGEYYFLGLDAGTYSVLFVIPDGMDYTASNTGDDALDSDIVPGMNGMTDNYVLDPGELDFTVDAGLYVPPNGEIGDPCQCLNNSTTEDNGQFTETFTVRSYPNETWTVIDGTGMWTAPNGEPPVAPVPVTFPFPMVEVTPGVYEYTFRLVDEISYTVVTTNGFDTLSISNVCEYPTLNIEEVPSDTLCLADAPIDLDANPNLPGNVFFTINGEISTEIDPSVLDTGSYELVATLIPLDPRECEATIVTQFNVTAECLATVGDRVWLDLDCDGIQGGNEPGVPGVEVRITGTAEFLDPNIDMTTFTDANGNYEFMVPPGNYKLTFGSVPGYEVTTPNQGGNDERDSDVDPVTMMTEVFHLDPDEINLSFDLGFCPECININYPGAIGFDQYLCGPGNDPDELVSLAEPTGGDGPIEYLWMRTAGTPNAPIQTWQPIPNTNSPTYDPGPVFETTYFARCARTEDCGSYLESNIITITVGDESGGTIASTGIACWNQPFTLQAVDLPPAGASVRWNFGGNATPATATGHRVTTTWSSVGDFEVEMIVTSGECTAYVYDIISVSTLPTVCNQGLVMDLDILDEENGQVSLGWEMSANIDPLMYHIEHSVDGENFSRVYSMNEEERILNGIRYYEYLTTVPKKGRNFYRVEVEDSMGNTAYSNIEEAIIYTDSKIAMLYPNPVQDQLSLEIFETFDEEEVFIEVFAVSGKLMATIPVDATIKNLQLDFSVYPAGAYLIRLRLGETNIRTMKVIKR